MRCKECGEYFQSEYESATICGACPSPHVEEVKLDGAKERYEHGLTLAAITEIYGPAALMRVMELAASPAFIIKVKRQDEERAAHRRKELN